MTLFPNVPLHVVRNELRKNEHDVELTIQCLWRMQTDVPSTDQSDEQAMRRGQIEAAENDK